MWLSRFFKAVVALSAELLPARGPTKCGVQPETMGDRGRDADVLLGGWGYREHGRVEDEDAIVNRVVTLNEGGVGREAGLA